MLPRRCVAVNIHIVYTETFFTRNLISMFIQFNIYTLIHIAAQLHLHRRVRITYVQYECAMCNFRCKFTLNLCTYRLNQVIWTSTYTIIHHTQHSSEQSSTPRHSVAYTQSRRKLTGRRNRKIGSKRVVLTFARHRLIWGAHQSAKMCVCVRVCAVLFKIIWS